jgi:hypothetical protein
MPFKSKKQKRTIDAAAHNPAFAKKVGINVADAKRMSAHGKGQTKFKEERTEVKDKDGNVTSWRDESDWRPAKDSKKIATPGKYGAGRSTAKKLAGDAAAQTKKMSKAEESMLNDFTDFIVSEDGPGQFGMNNPRPAPAGKAVVQKKSANVPNTVIDPNADHPQNWKPITSKDQAEYARRMQWYRDNDPDAFNRFTGPNTYNDMVKWKRMRGEKDVILPVDPEGAPMDRKAPMKPIKKSDASGVMGDDPAQNLALGGDDDQMSNMAEAAYSAKAGRAGKDLGKKGKNFSKISKSAGGGEKGNRIAGKVLKDIRAKNLKESILVLSQMIAEAKKKEMKCNECGMWESKCSCDHTNESYTINGKKVSKAAYNAEMKKAGKKTTETFMPVNKELPKSPISTVADKIKSAVGSVVGGKKDSVPADVKKDNDDVQKMYDRRDAQRGDRFNAVDVDEGNDGNLANNAKPYDKVTRGDVIAGRLGKDEMGGKKKEKNLKELDTSTLKSYQAKNVDAGRSAMIKGDKETLAKRTAGKAAVEKKLANKGVEEGNDGNLANNAKPYDKVTRGDVIAGRLGKDEMGGKKKAKKQVNEWGVELSGPPKTGSYPHQLYGKDRERYDAVPKGSGPESQRVQQHYKDKKPGSYDSGQRYSDEETADYADRLNAVRAARIANNELTPGEWISKGVNAVRSTFGGEDKPLKPARTVVDLDGPQSYPGARYVGSDKPDWPQTKHYLDPKADAQYKDRQRALFPDEFKEGYTFENENDTYPDHEGRMAKAELLEIAKNAMEIFKIVKEGENLDGWISSYISVANDHLNSVAQALVYDEVRDNMSIPSDDEYMESLRESLENFKRQ